MPLQMITQPKGLFVIAFNILLKSPLQDSLHVWEVQIFCSRQKTLCSPTSKTSLVVTTLHSPTHTQNSAYTNSDELSWKQRSVVF